MSDQGEIILRGKIRFPPADRPKQVGRVVARVEDVSRVDAPATKIAEQVQEQVALRQGEGEVPFVIRVPADAIDERGRYTLRAHVDVTGTGSVTPGDFVSTRSYPVLSQEEEITVDVRRV